MKRTQWLLVLFLVAFIYLGGVQADSDSGSGSDSNESGSGEKKHKNKKHIYPPPPPPPSPHPYIHPNYYNHPVYMPQGPPIPYGGYYPPPMPYYNYNYPPPTPAAPMQPYNNLYPYGGYYNQAPPLQVQTVQQPGLSQVPNGPSQEPQGFLGIPGGTSIINHSLKVNKEYKEDGHHYKAD